IPVATAGRIRLCSMIPRLMSATTNPSPARIEALIRPYASCDNPKPMLPRMMAIRAGASAGFPRESSTSGSDASAGIATAVSAAAAVTVSADRALVGDLGDVGSTESGARVNELEHDGQATLRPTRVSGARTRPRRQYGQSTSMGMETGLRTWVSDLNCAIHQANSAPTCYMNCEAGDSQSSASFDALTRRTRAYGF